MSLACESRVDAWLTRAASCLDGDTSQQLRAPPLGGPRQPFQHLYGRVPVDAAIRDALSVDEGLAGNQVLAPCEPVAMGR